MKLLGKQLAVLNKMYGCDCCASWIIKGDLAVVLCYKDENGTLTFEWECLNCQGVGA